MPVITVDLTEAASFLAAGLAIFLILLGWSYVSDACDNKIQASRADEYNHSDDAVRTHHPAGSHVVPLRPCPCCGAPAEFVKDNEWRCWQAMCTKCGIETKYYDSRMDLVNEWNTRPALPDAVRAVVEAAVACRDAYMNARTNSDYTDEITELCVAVDRIRPIINIGANGG